MTARVFQPDALGTVTAGHHRLTSEIRGHRSVRHLVEHEARSILARLQSMRPYSEHNPMVPAAAVDPKALRAIEAGLSSRRRKLRSRGHALLAWLHSPRGRAAKPEDLQRRLTQVRLLFNGILSEFDIFSDVLTQRAEHHVGQLLAGLDFAAEDMMRDLRHPFAAPNVVTYLDRGHGAAIRRALTRLPSGGLNAVAVVRVPRERMGSTGVAGSVAHEVGHQAAALLDLVAPAREASLAAAARHSGLQRFALEHYARWASEIIADFWAVGRIGVAHTLGLFALLTLPTPQVFMGSIERVHPIPWIRVHIGAALGNALWPHPQWPRLSEQWTQLYPHAAAPEKKKPLLAALMATLPTFVEVLLQLRAPRLHGQRLMDTACGPQWAPERLLRRHEVFRCDFERFRRARPSEVFAVLGQARAAGVLAAETEASLLDVLLLDWAVRRQRPQDWSTSPAQTPLGQTHRRAGA